MTESVLSRVRVVLFEPQNPINIAAVVRAMKNMGVSSLRLVRPVEYDPYRLEGIAHDTMDIIDRIEHFEDLDAALADCVYVAAYTARRRAAKWTTTTPRESAAAIVTSVSDGPAALLFGREDNGLPNEALDRARVVVNIPTTEHASLNLAQAVLVALYELHLAAGDATRVIGPPRDEAPPASNEAYERLFANAAQALEIIAFFKTRFPEHIMRTVRSLAYRAAPDAREIELMRAMAIEVVRAMERERKQHTSLQQTPNTDGST
jgi:tRNA/rRNA methyltransferase/tRNA (cytidine32/uridine32-2'-O)-methyltransferase